MHGLPLLPCEDRPSTKSRRPHEPAERQEQVLRLVVHRYSTLQYEYTTVRAINYDAVDYAFEKHENINPES